MRRLLPLLFCLLMASVAGAAPTVIGTPAVGNIGAVVGTSLTFSATCPNTGTSRVAIACLNLTRGGTITVTSYTWNGVAMTPLGAGDNPTDGPYAALYLLKNPTCDGAAHNAVITMSGTSHMIVGNIMFLQDVDQTTSTDTVVTSTGTAMPVTVNASSDVEDFVVDCAAAKNSNTNLVKDASQTLQSLNQTTNATASQNIEGGMSTEAGAAGTTTMSWSGSAGVGWAQAAVSVNPVSVVGTRRRVPPRHYLRAPQFPFFYGALD